MPHDGGYDRLLVPVDGSDAAMVAVDEAIRLADGLGAAIEGLYAVDTTHYYGISTEELVLASLEREGETALSDLEERCQPHGIPVETTLERGHPGDVILDYASENEVDAVVMATHGRGGLGRVLLGSVTEHVVRHADVPVLTVRVSAEMDD